MNSPPQPPARDLSLYRGDTRDPMLEVIHKAAGVPVDLTGVTVRLQVRDGPTLLLERSSAPGGGITVTPLEGRVTIRLTASDWATLLWSRGRYDLEHLYPDGTRKTMLRGSVVVTGDVTR